jgi:hypothetical protein
MIAKLRTRFYGQSINKSDCLTRLRLCLRRHCKNMHKNIYVGVEEFLPWFKMWLLQWSAKKYQLSLIKTWQSLPSCPRGTIDVSKVKYLLFSSEWVYNAINQLRRPFLSRVARWYVFKPKTQIWINFGGPWNWKCSYILWSFAIF